MAAKRKKTPAKRMTPAQAEQRRRAPTRHGAKSYLARTEQRLKITADMALVESRVLAEYAGKGARGMTEQAALRFETAAALLWGHMQTGAEAFGAGLKTWGWLQGAAVRSWRDYAAHPGGDDQPVTAGRVIESLGQPEGRLRDDQSR